MDGRDRHHSQPNAVADALSREPNDTAEQRIAEATKAHAEETLWERLGKNIDRQNRVLADLTTELRYQRERGPDQQLSAVVGELSKKLVAVEARSHINEAALNVMTEVRDEIRSLTALIRSAINGSGGQHAQGEPT